MKTESEENNKKYTCQYCKWWIRSKVIRRITVEGEKKKNEIKLIKRNCPVKNKKPTIESNSPACKFFSPENFWCDKFHCWLSIPQCLARRRNISKLEVWETCKKCRQFELEIREVATDYWINGKLIKEPKEPKKKVKTKGEKGKKIIKRRKKEWKEKRTITRRKPKPKKIKRRKKVKEDRSLDRWAKIILKDKYKPKKKGERKIKRRVV